MPPTVLPPGMVLVTRPITRKLIRGLILGAMLALAGCASSRTSRDGIARRSANERALENASTELKEPARSKQSVPPSSGSPRSRELITQTSASEKTKVSGEEDAAASDTDPQRETTNPASSPTLQDDTTAPCTLSLGGILHLADAHNPNVGLARERIDEAYSRVERAETLWIPSLRAGVNYNHHEGAIQDVAGNVFQTDRSALGGGFGANFVGAASPAVPGLVAQFHLSDAIFQPKIAGHQAASRQFGAVAARNDVLRDAAVAYLELARAEHGMAIARQALQNTQQLAELTRQYSETGQGLQSDHQRMEAELAIRRDQMAIQQEAIEVASARLAQVLHADPSVLITTGEPTATALDIMAVEGTAAAYVVLGLSRRPELAEQKHLVCEAVERLNREIYAPLIPSVLLGMSYGGMGGGLGNNITNSSQRWDADAVAYWELRNLGFGDRAARAETASSARQAQLREVAQLDRVAREVVEAHTQVIQRQKRLELTQKGIAAAERSYVLNRQRIDDAQGLPIEVLQSIQALANAQRAYLNAVIDYNIAQFELSRATGWFVEE